MDYCGRFAPSPSGRLHWGSLVSGYASYFRAKSQQGKFIVRIEDLDFPRCPSSNIPVVLDELELLGINSDCPPIIQGQQLSVYEKILNELIEHKQAYYCTCTRALMKMRPCPCADIELQRQIAKGSLEHVAIRIDLSSYLAKHLSFSDSHLGLIEQCSLEHEIAHSLVLKRADNIIAYNLAVVIDDHDEGISEVVRGADMIDATFLQLCLYEILGYRAPKFFHVPLITDQTGNKLSKQNKAPAVLCTHAPHHALLTTYKLLGQKYGSLLSNKLAHDMDAIYSQLLDLVQQNLNKANIDKRIALLHPCELANSLISYGYALINNNAITENLTFNAYLEPKILGKELVVNCNIDMSDKLPLIADYYHSFNALLSNLSKSFTEQNMPYSAIVI